MTAYDNDPRVEQDGHHYWLLGRCGERTTHVAREADGMWGHFVEDIRLGCAMYADADAALRTLIGDPQ